MPKYLIERNVAGAGRLSFQQLQQVARTSCRVLGELGPAIQWLESHVTPDGITCLYIAPDESMLREHALRGGFPADRISRVIRTIDPTTAE
jgi:Protein of unknown function (DUF4242)